MCGGVLVDPGAAGFPVTSTAPTGPQIAASGHTTTVRVTTKDMRFHPDTVAVPAGDRLVIEVANTDPETSHDLVLANGAKTRRLRPGTSQTLDAGVLAGSLDGWCSVVGHRQMGMRFTVRVIGGSASAHPASPSPTATTTPVDLHGTPGPDVRATDARLAPATKTTTHRVTLTVTEAELQVAPGVWQRRWPYNGTAPGPTLRGHLGDIFDITIVNDASMGHSIDFHAGSLAPDEPMRTIPPGATHRYTFTATHAGIWMYHCSTRPMSAHIAAGMHGVVIIDPPELTPVDREYVLVQSEVYLGPNHARGSASEVDAAKVTAETPDAVVFNAVTGQYDHHPLTARIGERVRFWVLDAGPNRPTSFHIVGGQFDTVYAEGAWLLRGAPGQPDAPGGAQVLALAPAQGGFVELTFPEAGHYPIVSHLMVDAERGAHAIMALTP